MKEFKFELAPTVKITAGDKEYILAIDNAAIKRWEEATGKDLMAKGETLETARDVIALFWAAALLHQPEMTQEDVDHILYPGNLSQVTEVLEELLRDVMPEPVAGEVGEVKN